MISEQLIRVLETLHPLPAGFKNALDQSLEKVTYPKGYLLVNTQTPATHTYFLEEGFAVSYHQQGHRKSVTTFWRPGSIILSPKSFFEQSRSEENIQLTVDSKLVSISHLAINKLFDTFPIANVLVRSILAEFHSQSNARLVDIHLLTAWELYSKLTQQYPGIELNSSQELIASYLKITPQSLSRLRHAHNKS